MLLVQIALAVRQLDLSAASRVQVKGLGFLVTPDVRPASTTIRDALAAAVKDGPAASADLKPSKEIESLQV